MNYSKILEGQSRQYILIYNLKFSCSLGKPQKKKKVPLLVAGPLRGGGGVKAGPLRKKELFLKLFFYFVAI